MASLISNKIGKRNRNRSSTSSTGSTSLTPEQKKARNAVDELEEQSNSDDEILTAVNMAEGVNDKLDEILSKLAKLDVIQESVEKIEVSLIQLEERTATLEVFEASASKDIEDLKQSATFLGDHFDTSLKDLQNQLDESNIKTEELQKEFKAKIKEYDESSEKLKMKDLYLETYSRRENIKFLNIDEEEDEDVEGRVREFMRDQLRYSDHDMVEIQRIHRNGKRVGSKPRPILARFLRSKDCEKTVYPLVIVSRTQISKCSLICRTNWS